jgi:hypothetical protein
MYDGKFGQAKFRYLHHFHIFKSSGDNWEPVCSCSVIFLSNVSYYQGIHQTYSIVLIMPYYRWIYRSCSILSVKGYAILFRSYQLHVCHIFEGCFIFVLFLSIMSYDRGIFLFYFSSRNIHISSILTIMSYVLVIYHYYSISLNMSLHELSLSGSNRRGSGWWGKYLWSSYFARVKYK